MIVALGCQGRSISFAMPYTLRIGLLREYSVMRIIVLSEQNLCERTHATFLFLLTIATREFVAAGGLWRTVTNYLARSLIPPLAEFDAHSKLHHNRPTLQ